MSTCDDVQLSLEMARRGVTAPVAPALVNAHVATCPDCAAYAAIIKETEQMTTAYPVIDAETVYQRVQQELTPASWGRRLLLGLLGLVALAGFCTLIYLDEGPDEGRAWIAKSVILLLTLGIAFAAYGRRRARTWQALANAPHGDVLATRRAELRDLYRIACFGLVLFPVVTVASALGGITTVTDAALLVGMAALVVNNIVMWRRVRAELRELT